MEKAIFAWSGGKDSTLALHRVLLEKKYDVVSLLTTMSLDYDRISMHGVRRELLEAQAETIGIPLKKVYVKTSPSNVEYEKKMSQTMLKFKSQGVNICIFGDIFLEDLRVWREEKLSQIGFTAHFPIWKIDTLKLAKEFFDLNYKAKIAVVDTKAINQSFSGREFDQSFVDDLPKTADPCGENGEFHSFVYSGPIFKKQLEIKTGEQIMRENRFYYTDLLFK